MLDSVRDSILSNYSEVKNTLKDYPNVRLIAVSKRQDNEKLQVLVDMGHLDFGENYLQEWEGKVNFFPSQLRWHFIGQVQSRKVASLITKGAYMIHGFGSASSLKKLKQNEEEPRGGCLLQINLESEEQKGGVAESEIEGLYEQGMLERIKGLMTIPPIGMNDKELAKHFMKMNQLKEKWNFSELSMGMSKDWKIAISEGATMIRLGTTIFGERKL